MSTIRPDIRDGASGRLSADGWECERVMVVENMTKGSAASRLYRSALAPGVPRLYSQHPSIPHCLLREIRAEPNESGTVITLRLAYRTDLEKIADAAAAVRLVRVSASVVAHDVNTDITGQPLVVSYVSRSEGGGGEQTGTVSLLEPQITVAYDAGARTVPAAVQRYIAECKRYVGLVNSGACPWDSSAKPREWLCTGINGTTEDGGETWNSEPSFQYSRWDPDYHYFGWDAFIAWKDPNTGRPPSDVMWVTERTHNGMNRYQIYNMVDFRAMNLTR